MNLAIATNTGLIEYARSSTDGLIAGSRGRGLSRVNAIRKLGSVAGAMLLVAIGVQETVVPTSQYRIAESPRTNQKHRSEVEGLQQLYSIENPVEANQFFQEYPLAVQFLYRIHNHIFDIYGKIDVGISVWSSPMDGETLVYLTLHSGVQDESQLADLENRLFDVIKGDEILLQGLQHVVLVQG